MGQEAKVLSASTVSRLKQVWVEEYSRWREVRLDKDRWVDRNANTRLLTVFMLLDSLRQENGWGAQTDDFPGNDQEYQLVRIFGKDTYHRMPYY